MDKKIAGLLGAAAALTAVSAASAATGPAPATSYRDLLEPVPNALAALRADEARNGNSPTSEGVRVAQTVIVHHHHHRWWRHHHHHRWWRYHHHHHHHHY